MKRLKLLVVAAVAGAFWAQACSSDHPTTPPQHEHATATVALSQTAVNLATGEHVTLSAQPKCSCGEVMSSPVTWTSNAPAIASVSAAGEVIGVSFGSATITAAADGKSATAAVQVAPLGTVVGASGGVVTSADGNVVLEIPAGALDANTDITITPVADAAFGGDPTFLAGSGYEIKPAGVTLHLQVRLRLRFDPAHLPQGVLQDQLRIRERDRVQNQWRDCDQQGLQGQAVMANISNFGTFGIMVQATQGTMVGALGGTVTSDDGNFELVIPAGALATATDIVITKVSDSEFNGDANYVSGTAYKVEPEGTTLSKPGTVVIKYNSSNVPSWMDATQLRIQRRDRIQNQWQDCDHTGIQANRIGANITGFSTFAITGRASNTGGGGGGGGASASVASVTVTPSTVNLDEGDVLQLTAVVYDSANNVLTVPVTWSVTNPSVATVSSTGLLTAVTNGSTSVTASAGGKSGGSSVNVTKKIATITITGSTTVQVGATTQLTATAYSSTGDVVSVTFTWASANTAVATVSSTGLVTGVTAGTSAITASAKGVTGTITVTVSTTPGGGGGGGGETETTGNNMSWPVVFSDGIGVTGLAVATDPGVRPTSAETAAAAELAAIPFASPSAVFWYSGNAVDATGYYLQATANTWRAQLIDGTGQAKYDASAYWGDNLSGSASLKVGHPIRIEVALSATGVGTLQGYNMPYVANPSSPDEIQGTDGTLGDFVPLIYTIGPTLVVEQLSGPGGSVIATVSSGAIGAEMNVGGRLVYGGQFKPSVAGTYRLRFILASGANTQITAVGNATGTAVVVSSTETAIEIQVTP